MLNASNFERTKFRPARDDEIRARRPTHTTEKRSMANATVDSAAPWPDGMNEAACHGIAGEFVRMVAPDTESDPAGLLMQFLAAFGSLVGRGPHYRVEGAEHHANLFVLLIGQTSKGRKGTAWARVREVFQRVLRWKPEVDGTSTGEGLKYNVRDAREELNVSRVRAASANASNREASTL